jgi:photosystem II stability/assembly factor-like uncharacterized protein
LEVPFQIDQIMKKLSIFLLLFALSSSPYALCPPLFAQGAWHWQNPGPTAFDLTDVWFTDSFTGWVVGKAGTILHTTDGGERWDVQNSSTGFALSSVCFPDPLNGWAVGDAGTLVHTTNGGETWHYSYTGDFKDLTSIFFKDRDHGWITGPGALLTHTGDGGVTWDSIDTWTDYDFNDVYFTDLNNGWAVGVREHDEKDRGYGGKVIRSRNGGHLGWELQPPNNFCYELTGVFMVDTLEGWACGHGCHVAHTTDGGRNWDVKVYPTPFPPADLTGIFFSDRTHGWASATQGFILRTDDAGQNWAIIQTGVSLNLNSLWFADSLTGWAVGEEGTILHSEDGGLTWSAQTRLFTSSKLTDVFFLNASKGWAVGAAGAIIRTNDGGVHWASQAAHVTYNLLSVAFTDENTGWACGYDGVVLRTINGGQQWSRSTVFDSWRWYYDCFFIGKNNGWICGSECVYRTTDGGASWSAWTSDQQPLIYSLFFLDSLRGWFGGYGAVYHTSNGGLSWDRLTGLPGGVTDIMFFDENNGWAVSQITVYYKSAVFSTMDGGLTWTERLNVDDAYFSDIGFSDPDHAWVVGRANNYLYETSDGGDTWQHVFLAGNNPAPDLAGIFFLDANNGWMVGSNGTVLKWEDNQPFGIDEPGPDVAVKVYPNPTTGKFKVQSEECKVSFEVQRIEVVGIDGRLLQTRNPEPETRNLEFDISNLPAGVYFVRITFGNSIIVKKVIKI